MRDLFRALFDSLLFARVASFLQFSISWDLIAAGFKRPESRISCVALIIRIVVLGEIDVTEDRNRIFY